MFILAALVILVLLIACANVANLLIAQAISRAREMALRVSIGAGRWRLIQLVLVESAVLAVCASVAGAVFAWWAAPVVVSLLAFQEPVQLVLDVNGRVLAFAIALTLAVTMVFGLAPALRASSVRPLGALKGHDDQHRHRRVVRSLIAAQMAFCLFVVFIAGLFASTLRNLSNRPLGFEADRLLLLEVNLSSTPSPGSEGKQPPQVWAEVGERIRTEPGVEATAFAGWVPLSENRWRAPVFAPGRLPDTDNSPYFLAVSPAYFDTMQIGLVAGRDFRIGDTPPTRDEQQPVAGVGIVNEAFARTYFDGQNPIGRQVLVRQYKRSPQDTEVDAPMDIVGLVRDSVYNSLREPMRPTVFVPNEAVNHAALVVRTTGDPLALGPTIRRRVTCAHGARCTRGAHREAGHG